MSARRVLLVRHTEVAAHWIKKCYGRSDIALSRAGRRQATEIVAQLAGENITAIVHSGLQRAAHLAHALATTKNLIATPDPRWQERDFGTWEGRSWHAIWKETGNAMDGMFTDPEHYRPGGGETTAELVARSTEAWRALPSGGLVAVITHGGPIAAIRTMLARAPLTDIVNYRVTTGAIITAS